MRSTDHSRRRTHPAVRIFRDPNLVRMLPKLRHFRACSWWAPLYPAFWRCLALQHRKASTREPAAGFGGNAAGPARGYLLFTPAHDREGVGGQVIKWCTAFLLAQRFGLRFVHHPFTSDAHCPDMDWEGFLGFGNGELQFDEVRSERVQRIVGLPPFRIDEQGLFCCGRFRLRGEAVAKTVDSLCGPETGIRLGPPTWAYDVTPAAPVLRMKYLAARRQLQGRPRLPAGQTAVAVHVRRGDVVKTDADTKGPAAARWLSSGYYRNVLTALARMLGDSAVAYLVYTDDPQLPIPDFLPGKHEVRLRPNQGLRDEAALDFDDMVNADILVMGASAFSYVAALVSTSVVIAPSPWCHRIPQNDRWISCGPDGSFHEGHARTVLPDGAGQVPIQASSARNG